MCYWTEAVFLTSNIDLTPDIELVVCEEASSVKLRITLYSGCSVFVILQKALSILCLEGIHRSKLRLHQILCQNSSFVVTKRPACFPVAMLYFTVVVVTSIVVASILVASIVIVVFVFVATIISNKSKQVHRKCSRADTGKLGGFHQKSLYQHCGSS